MQISRNMFIGAVLLIPMSCSKPSTEETDTESVKSNAANDASDIKQTYSLLADPLSIQIGETLDLPLSFSGTHQRISLLVDVEKDYATINVFVGQTRLVDNFNLAVKGENRINFTAQLNESSGSLLSIRPRSSNIVLKAVEVESIQSFSMPSFNDISKDVGFETEETYKYGGPAVADVDADGDYDFALNNHNFIPTQLVLNNAGKHVSVTKLFPGPLDYHGSSFGDYDRDGDLDLMVAFGGGNGTSPTSYALMQNNNGVLSNVAEKVGITTPARGRSPRWMDLDSDGDLDIVLVNAKTPNYDGPQQLFFRNKGDGTFEQVRVKDVEHQYAERVLVNDFNSDGRADLLLFSPVSLWRNDGDFSFTDVSHLLPETIRGAQQVIGAAAPDVNNDGMTDFYFARGKTAYQLSRKSIDFNPETKRVDVRDDGEKGTTLVELEASGSLLLSDMELTYRQYNDGFAIFLGAEKTRKIVKAKGFQVTQLPEEMKNAASELEITQEDAMGWPNVRDVNGLYIGYVGDDKWKAEWVRDQNIYWTVTFSLTGVEQLDYDWQANNRNVQDALIVQTQDGFEDQSRDWNIPQGGNHTGVTYGDFNNDGWVDLFVYRYGYLTQRINDLLLTNVGGGYFEISTEHGARVAEDPGHGDMGQAFDFDMDGRVDLLNGSEEEGHWYIYKNATDAPGNYIAIEVGTSPKEKVDAYSAFVTVTDAKGNVYKKRVGSAGEIFSQSMMNIVHFGLGEAESVNSAIINWRNGEVLELSDLAVNKVHKAR